MSLCSLKKSRPTAKPVVHISVEDFIDDALAYANGLTVNALQQPTATVTPIHRAQHTPEKAKPMKKRTFTLSEQCVANLDALSKKTGITKSRLLRILVNKAALAQGVDYLLESDIK